MKPQPDPPWFPNFCRFTTVFAVMVVAELVVLTIALSPGRAPQAGFYDFVTTVSFLVQWIAVFSAGLLCALRPWLSRLPVAMGLVLAYGVILAVCVAGSWTGVWADRALGLGYSGGVSVAELVLGNLMVCALVAAAALRYFYVQHRWRRDVEARAEAQLRALQARIRPHFLFNSMNTIASLIRRAPERAERAVEDLSELFRSVLKTGTGNVPLDEELELCRRYLELESLRLGDRLTVDWQMDSLPAAAVLPPLTLQPLLENAIYHGIQHLPSGGTIGFGGREMDGWLELWVENPVSRSPTVDRDSGHGLALDNIRARLQQRFDGRATMELSRPEGGFRVDLRIPLEGT